MLEHYIVRFIFKYNILYCLWYTDSNGVDLFVTECEKIVVFNSKTMLDEFVNKNCLSMSSVQYDYQLKIINDVIDKKIVGYDILSDFWNIFQDISKSTGSIFLGNNNKFNELYNKIFHASLNELNDTSDLESEELELLKIIFEDGKQIIRKYIFSF